LSKLNAKSGLAEAIQGELRSKWGRGCCCSLKTPLLNGLPLPGPWQIDLSRSAQLTDGFQLPSYCLFNKRLENLIVNVQLNLQHTTKGSLPVQHSVALQETSETSNGAYKSSNRPSFIRASVGAESESQISIFATRPQVGGNSETMQFRNILIYFFLILFTYSCMKKAA
jgi:hypothetical protein